MWGGTQGPAWARCELTTELSPQLHNYFRWLVNTQTSSQKYTLAQNTGSSLAPELSSSRDGTVSKTTDSSTRGYQVAMAPSWQWRRKALYQHTGVRRSEVAALRIAYGSLSTVEKGSKAFKMNLLPHRIRQHPQLRLHTWLLCDAQDTWVSWSRVPETAQQLQLRAVPYWGPEFCSQQKIHLEYSQKDTHIHIIKNNSVLFWDRV